MKELTRSLILAGSIILFFWASGLLVRKKAVRHEVVRKTVHVLSGTACAVCVFFFESPGALLILVCFFIPFFVISARVSLFPGVYRKDRHSYGPAFLAAACGALFLLFWQDKFVIFAALMTAACADSAAAVIGTRFPRGEYEIEGNRRTLAGSAAMWIATLVVVDVSLWRFTALGPLGGLPVAIACATFVTATEAVSPSDADNFAIPLMCALVLHLMSPFSVPGIVLFWGRTAVLIVVAVVSWRAGFLGAGGAIGVFLIGSIIFVTGGPAWFIPILVFFFSSSLISKWRKEHKAELRAFHAKSGPRDIRQVLAKGGIPCLLAICFSFTADQRLYFAYLCSLAAANADTWASEIGLLSRRAPVSILNWKPVIRGTSGGVSVTGYAAAGLGAMVIGAVGVPFYSAEHIKTRAAFLALVALAGVLACTGDSILGAAAQAKLRCSRCGEITENPNHCGEDTGVLASGKIWVNNEVVNLVCSFTGAAFALMVAYYM
ncbi:MAG: DUF92 domain-containing protein [Candidatus Lindowbacteria bacterium]|nr:DUF92 domain-containing protein [Candidatus Lindowbacteria bacterium]